MLMESVVKWTLGIKSQRVKKVVKKEEGWEVEIVPRRRSRAICSGCGKKRSGYDTLHDRVWRHVRCWGINVRLRYAPRRVNCRKCGIKVEEIPWSRGKSTLSVPLMILLAVYAKILSWEETARLCGVSWNTVRAAVN